MALHAIKQHLVARRIWSKPASLGVPGSKEVNEVLCDLPESYGTIHEELYPLEQGLKQPPGQRQSQIVVKLCR